MRDKYNLNILDTEDDAGEFKVIFTRLRKKKKERMGTLNAGFHDQGSGQPNFKRF